DLIYAMIDVCKKRQVPKRRDYCVGPVHRAIHSIAVAIEDHAKFIGVDSRFVATKLIEGDEPMTQTLKLSKNEEQLIGHIVYEMEQEVQMDREAALADMRYNFIEEICSDTVHKKGKSKEYLRSIKIDKILTHRFFSIPIFILAMFLIFYLSFNVVDSFLNDLLTLGIDSFSNIVDNALTNYGINEVVHSLIIDGIFQGVGGVLSLLPSIVALFFFLSILEDSGYMARIAFVLDKPMKKIGLSGKSLVSLVIGFGCSVPAIMSARTLASKRDQKMTIFLVPFISCSAKIPIYAMFSQAFFPGYESIAMIIIYVFGILMGTMSGFLLNGTVFKGQGTSFLMELPNYRLPSAKSVLLMIWDKTKDFLVRAFTVIFVASIIIWFLQSFDSRLNYISDSSDSILAYIGKMIAPIFQPLGFSGWETSTALITGLTAKESVISTLAILLNADATSLAEQLTTFFTPLSSISFLVFVLLYVPCIAAIKVTFNELKSKKLATFMIFYQLIFAWVISFIVYNIGRLFII
ncbi:MAG: ferrous iron transport protein B, partial [Clostridia bacterium]|nr:ferrous iron transport protein B [Clostridia bacterium]